MTDQYEVQRILDQLDRADNITQDLNDMADHSRWQGKWDEALKYCEESLDLAHELNDSRSEGISLLRQWAVHFLREKFEEAIDDCHLSRQAFDSVADDHGQVLAMFSLGMTYQEWGMRDHDQTKLHKALNTYGKALEVARGLKARSDFSRNTDKAELYQQLITEMRERFHCVATLYTQSSTRKKSYLQPSGGPRRQTTSSPVELQFIPIVGQIAAGKPIPTADDVEKYLATSRVKIDDIEYTIHPLDVDRGSILTFDMESQYFATPVRGDSMDQAGILEGDYVIIRRPRGVPPSPTPGDIVAAVIKGVDREATLKRFKRRNRTLILSPESSNPDNQPYEFTPSEWDEKVEIAGIAIAVLKRASDH